MAKVVIIGNIHLYQQKFNLLSLEINKNNISIVAALFNELDYNFVDGFPIVNSLDELKNMDFDYFILLDENKMWLDKIINVYHFKQQIIPIRVFEVPFFDFKKYELLLENTPTIISRHCWGGFLYNKLGLKFNSPFINLFLSDVDFNKLASNFSYYINQELVFVKEEYEKNLKRNFPVVKLGDITIYFNHYTSFDEAKKKWDERKKRINYDNLFFETTTANKDVALEFDSLPIKHKLCFYVGSLDSPNIIDFTELLGDNDIGTLGMMVNETGNGRIPYFNLIDLLLNFNFESRIQFK